MFLSFYIKKLHYCALFIPTVYCFNQWLVVSVLWIFSSMSLFTAYRFNLYTIYLSIERRPPANRRHSQKPRESCDAKTQRRTNDGATLTSADSSCNFLDKNRDKPSYSRENRRDFDTGEFMVVENVFSIGCGGWKVGDTTSEPSNEILHPIIKSSHKSSGDDDVRLCAATLSTLARVELALLPRGHEARSLDCRRADINACATVATASVNPHSPTAASGQLFSQRYQMRKCSACRRRHDSNYQYVDRRRLLIISHL